MRRKMQVVYEMLSCPSRISYVAWKYHESILLLALNAFTTPAISS